MSQMMFVIIRIIDLNHLILLNCIFIISLICENRSMRGSITFFLKLGLYFYLLLTWLKIICDNVDQSGISKIRDESNVIKRVGGQIPCQQICQEKYTLLTGDTSSQSWITYFNSAEAKDTTNKQIDDIADHYKKVCLNYATKKINATDYRISFIDVGCFFKKQINHFECFDTQIGTNKFRIIRSTLNITLWQKVSYFIKNNALLILPKEFITQILPIITNIIPSETLILSIVVFAAFVIYLKKKRALNKTLSKQKNNDKQKNIFIDDDDVDKIQYGFRVMDYCKENQYLQIKQPFNRLNFDVQDKIKDALQRTQNKKIKLLTQSTQGVGVNSNIQAWCQQMAFFQGKQVIHYNLESNITDPKLFNNTHLHNIQAIFYAIINKSNRNIQNMILYQLQNLWHLYVATLRYLFEVSIWILIGLALITVYFQGICLYYWIIIFLLATSCRNIFSFILSIKSKFNAFLKDKWQTIKSLFFQSNFIYYNKKIIIIEGIEKLKININNEKQIVGLIQKIQIVQEGKDYDVILISKKRHLSWKLIQVMKKEREDALITVQFQHKIIYPMTFYQIQHFLSENTLQASLNQAKLLGFFSNNCKELMRSLKHNKIAKKYIEDQNENNFTRYLCFKEINSILHQAKQRLDNSLKKEQIQKLYPNEEQRIKSIQVQIQRIIKLIREHVRNQNNQDRKPTKLWQCIHKAYQRSCLQNEKCQMKKQIDTVYRWNRYQQKCQSDPQSNETLQQWLEDQQQTKLFKQKDFKDQAIFKLAIQYLNYKQILLNGNFTNICYVFSDLNRIDSGNEQQNNVVKSKGFFYYLEEINDNKWKIGGLFIVFFFILWFAYDIRCLKLECRTGQL